MNPVKTFRFAAAGLLLANAVLAAPAPHPTVGDITENNGLLKNRFYIVKTPSILRVQPSEPVAPDPRAAIENYD